MLEYLTEFLLLFAVIDPIGTVPVYLEATKNLPLDQKKRVARKAPIIAFFVLLFFIAIGQVILEGMDISLDAFQVSGGVILFLFSLTMILGEGKPGSEIQRITDYNQVTVFPIAMPSIASPGAILAVVLMTDNNTYSWLEQVETTVLVAAVIAVTMGILFLANYVQRFIGDYGITVISKIMGLILASYAVQSVLTGTKSFFEL